MQQYVHEEEGTEATTSGQLDWNLGTIKRKIPEFKGNKNAEEYLEWERKVEMIFEFHNYFEKNSQDMLCFGGISSISIGGKKECGLFQLGKQ
jgi:hypothetical protein